MREFIEAQIAERRRRLQDLDKQRTALRGELSAFEEMLAYVVNETETSTNKRTRSQEEVFEAVRALSSQWRNVLSGLALAGGEFDIAKVLEMADRAGVQTSPVNVRSQLSIYTAKGILDRLGGGRYRVTNNAFGPLVGGVALTADARVIATFGAEAPANNPTDEEVIRRLLK